MKRELHASLDGILVAHGKSTFEELVCSFQSITLKTW